MRRAVTFAAALALAGVFGAASVGADPVNNQHASTFDVVCGGVHHTIIGTGAAGHDESGNSIFVLQGVDTSVNRGLLQAGKLTQCTTVFNEQPVTIYVLITPQG
jgi:hypothetical protein